MTFKEQLIVTIVDKALIGIVVAIAGFWLNRYLESFKARRALENELAKVRDQKKLQFLESQLTEFYWPLYLRLQMDNAVWEQILQRKSKDPIKASIAQRIENDFILPNHEAACQIIQSKIHLGIDPAVIEVLLKYVRHVAVYRAIRASGNLETDPMDVGERWPKAVFPLVERATLDRQREFQAMLEQTGRSAGR